MNSTTGATARLERLESRLAMRVAAQLSDAAEALPADAAERLRFAREKALERARVVRAAGAAPLLGRSGGAAVLGKPPSRWFKFAAVLPLLVLVAGLFLIQEWHLDRQLAAAAEIDAQLLADDLPPGAYSDPGFVEYLKTPRE